MARLYTTKEIQKALQELRIKPVKGNVTTKEAAEILTWRAKAEFNTDHTYPESAVRRRAQKGHISPAPESNQRINLYKVEDVFDLSLFPKRGLALQASQPDNQYTQQESVK